MKFFQAKPVQWGIFGLIVVITAIRSFTYISSRKETSGYDEQMWTSSSISSYNMFFKGYVRPTKELDNWFATYAWRNKVPVFTGEKWTVFNPDTIKFPYDYVTVSEKNQSYSMVVKYDTLIFPKEAYQWYDRDMWTFGWKAPNLGKYLMGWTIDMFSSSRPDPKGYFEYFIPEHDIDSLHSDRHVPSTSKSSAPFSYAPAEYVKTARNINAVFLILTVAVTFLLGWWFLNFWVGFTASAWLVLNKIFIEVNSAVGLDSFSVFFSMASILGLLITLKKLQQQEKWWKIILWAGVTGVLIGLAISSKLNAGVLVYITIAVYVLGAILLLLKSRSKTKAPGQPVTKKGGWKQSIYTKGFVSGLMIAGLSVAVFLKLNPQVKGDASGKIKTMQSSIDDYFSRRARIFTQNQLVDRMKLINAELMQLAKDGKINPTDAASFNARLQQINTQLGQGLNNQPEPKQDAFLLKKSYKLYLSLEKLEDDVRRIDPSFETGKGKFMNWVDIKENWGSAFALVMHRIAIVEEGKDTRYYGTFGSLLKFPYNPLDGLLALAGLIFLALMAFKEIRKEMFILPSAVLLIAFLMILYGNVDFVWQDWPRYMTPVFPLYALLIGVGIVELSKWIMTKANKKKAA